MRWMCKKGKSMWAIYFLTIRVPQSAFFGDKNNALYIINIGIKPIFKDFAKKMKKIVEKVCTYRNYPYLCIRNQEISSYKTKKTVANRKMSNGFEKKLKKVAKKFLKNLEVTKKDITFATDFRLKFERSFSNGSLIYWLYN